MARGAIRGSATECPEMPVPSKSNSAKILPENHRELSSPRTVGAAVRPARGHDLKSQRWTRRAPGWVCPPAHLQTYEHGSKVTNKIEPSIMRDTLSIPSKCRHR